ncbi:MULTISPECIES: cupin domain-containing protein [unclassified Sedimentibacter]|uniref:cupin domain-containing protein n=1 Tax=unclassified Sedimentibacter TaxID=2649220 RepID=UPI0027E1A437|nr:cupin domain-containing protein [Sedimentibacter sp. MB35-C1]WMJ77301.1 cupin domain-containing protein [Sedimentibacter sp. MB35-C1]
MRDNILIVNEEDIAQKFKNEHEPYAYSKREVACRKDFEQCCVAVYEIPPKKSNYPLHYHTANTEVFYIIQGKGVLVTTDGKKAIKQGDFIVCPPTEKSAHKIINTSENEILKYIDFDTINSPDTIYYPDSGKVGIVIHNKSSNFYRIAEEVDYYDGE